MEEGETRRTLREAREAPRALHLRRRRLPLEPLLLTTLLPAFRLGAQPLRHALVLLVLHSGRLKLGSEVESSRRTRNRPALGGTAGAPALGALCSDGARVRAACALALEQDSLDLVAILIVISPRVGVVLVAAER